MIVKLPKEDNDDCTGSGVVTVQFCYWHAEDDEANVLETMTRLLGDMAVHYREPRPLFR